MLESAIFDPEFKTGDSALFCYSLNEETVIVRIHDVVYEGYNKWYAVSTHSDFLQDEAIIHSEQYTSFFADDLQDQHQVFLVEPDELEYPVRAFDVIKGNKHKEEK